MRIRNCCWLQVCSEQMGFEMAFKGLYVIMKSKFRGYWVPAAWSPSELSLCYWNRQSGRRMVKVKVGFFYSSATSRTVQSQEVAVDWQEPMVLHRNAAATTHTTAPINHTRPSPCKHSPDGAACARKQTSDYSLLLSLSTSEGWKAESTWLASYILK